MRLHYLVLFILHIPVYLLAVVFALTAITNVVRAEVKSSISSLCQFPLLKPICIVASWRPSTSTTIPSFSIADAFDSEFESLDRLYRATADSSLVSRDLMHARIAIDDLVVVVKGAALRRRDQLVHELKAFGFEAREIAHKLDKFMWKVNTSITRVETANEQMIGLLKEQSETSSVVRALCTMSGDRLWLESCQNSRELHLLFDMALQAFESSITSLLKMADDLNGAFLGLDACLEVIHDMVGDEGQLVLAEKVAVLADIWTVVGGNRKAWTRLRTQAQALQLLINHHAIAQRYVSLAHKELLAMDLALEDLRSLTVESVLNQDVFPINSLVDTLSRGVEKLKQGRRERGGYLALDRPREPVQGPKSQSLFSVN